MKVRLFFILVPALILILTVIIFKINEDRLLNSAEIQELERVDAFVEGVSREYQHIKSMLAYISGQKLVGQMLTDARPSESSRLVDDFKARFRFSKLLEHQPDFRSLTLIDNSGKTILGLEQFGKKALVTDEDDIIDYSESWAFNNALKVKAGRVYVAMMQLETSNGHLTLPTKFTVDFLNLIVG